MSAFKRSLRHHTTLFFQEKKSHRNASSPLLFQIMRFFLQNSIAFWRVIISKPSYSPLSNNVFTWVHISFYKILPVLHGGRFAVLIFNCSTLDGTVSRQVFKPRAVSSSHLNQIYHMTFQLGPAPTAIGKTSSFCVHVLENTRASKLMSYRRFRWDNNIYSLWSCYCQISRSMLWTWRTFKLKSVFNLSHLTVKLSADGKYSSIWSCYDP